MIQGLAPLTVELTATTTQLIKLDIQSLALQHNSISRRMCHQARPSRGCDFVRAYSVLDSGFKI